VTAEARILLVEDDRNLRRVLGAMLAREGYEVEEAPDGAAALERLAARPPDVLLTDIRMPRLDGLELMRRCRERHPELPVVLVTAYGTIGDAVEAIRAGAFDYITKPFDEAELLRVVGNAARTRRAARREPWACPEEREWFGMIGGSAAWAEVRKMAEKAAATEMPVLLTGETGTGKELVARAIHRMSRRAGGPFLKINGAAIPPTLWEAEIFGYEKGAFTGAATSKPGRFELADGGTFFLDEVGEVPLSVQGKLLRVLQDRQFERVGGVRTITADVRLICASNRDLARQAEKGRFREDLFYRINGIPIRLPPLRERREDILPLAEFFLARCLAAAPPQAPRKRFSREAAALLERYRWPGNVRELENAVGRAVALSEGEEIAPADLCLTLEERPGEESAAGDAGFHEMVREHKRAIIRRAIRRAGGNKTKAAELLGLSPPYLFRLIRLLDIDT